MRLSHVRVAAVCVFAVWCLGQGSSGGAEPAAARVRSNLDQLHAWLGDADNGCNWKTYLRTSELEAQLAKGNAADPSVLAELTERFSTGPAGLESPPIVQVRDSVRDWQSELALADDNGLASVLATAKSNFQPLGEAHLQAARARLQAAVTDLDQYLASSSPANAAAWKTHLHWNELQAALAGAPNPKALETLMQPFKSGATGLEYAPFTNVKNELANYARAAVVVADPKQQETNAARLDEIAKLLANNGGQPSAEDRALIGRDVAWLEAAGAAPEIVARVRQKFSHANLYASVSQRLIDTTLEDAVSETRAIDDNILGAEIHGTAEMAGRIHGQPVPNSTRAAIEIRLTGNVHSDNVGTKGPVTICSSGETSVNAWKTLYVDPNGITAGCAQAQCSTNSTIHDICARFKFIEKFAWKQACKKKGQAEAEASCHAEKRIAEGMDTRATNLVTEANENYQEKFKAPLVRRGAFPGVFLLSSTASTVNLQVVQDAPDLLAASDNPPALREGHDLGLRIHESHIINFAATAIADETLTDEKLADLLKELSGNVPDELKITPDKDPWSITFVDRQTRPVSVSFADGGFTITIRGKQFTRGDQKITEPMEISARYKIELTPTGAKSVRQGDVVADYVKKGGLGVKEVAFKTFLKKKFEAVFKPEIASEGLTLKGRLAKAGKLIPKELQSQGGWLTIGWRIDNSGPKAADAPASVSPTATADTR